MQQNWTISLSRPAFDNLFARVVKKVFSYKNHLHVHHIYICHWQKNLKTWRFLKIFSQGQISHVNGTEFQRWMFQIFFVEYPGKWMPYNSWHWWWGGPINLHSRHLISTWLSIKMFHENIQWLLKPFCNLISWLKRFIYNKLSNYTK